MNEYYVEPIIKNTDKVESTNYESSLLENRTKLCCGYYENEDPLLSIIIMGCNRVDKTKQCIDSILKYTSDIDYELILVDNGSTDGTLDYFEEIEYKKKSIIRFTKNLGIAYPQYYTFKLAKGKYYFVVGNDMIVTTNWASNLIKCFESDPKIGMIVPMTSNTSNFQSPDLEFKTLDEMQEKAAKFNISDPSKWEEKMRLVTPIGCYRKDLLFMFGIYDLGYVHDFGEDDISIKLRRLGYKLIMCGDTFVHHDHVYDRNSEALLKSIESGKKNYENKYYGIDPWYDINDVNKPLIDLLNNQSQADNTHILGIDVRAGQSILSIKNKLRQKNIEVKQTDCIAFTTNAKYYYDLQTITDAKNVFCDRIEYISEHIALHSKDYIVLGEPINTYKEPIKLLQNMLGFLNDNGYLLFKLKNSSDVKCFFEILGFKLNVVENEVLNISPESIINVLKLLGYKNLILSATRLHVTQDIKNMASNLLSKALESKEIKEKLERLLVDEYLFCIKK